ncbi:hypothetical protein HN662_00180, partial [Candidatus Woesearchaeota archaeon]|nr:hypothetical protein [Candidatus Woesearchaeota archaeon]
GNVIDADLDGVADCNDDCTNTPLQCTPDLNGCNYYANCANNPDNDPRHCTWKGTQVGIADSGICDTDNEQYCWAETSPTGTVNAPCCGDDSGETWTYISDSKVLDIFDVGGSCVSGKWVEESSQNTLFYDLEIILR